MAENNRQAQPGIEEFDLLVVVDRAVAFLSRYKKILFIFTLAGGLLAFVVHKLKRKYFESSLILHSQILTNGEEIAIVTHWNEMLQDDDVAGLKTLMHCDDSVLDQIRTLAAVPILNTTTNSAVLSGFSIDVTVQNPRILPDLQKAIVYGLQNSDYVRQKVEMKRINLTDMISTLNKEIARVDSFDSYDSYRSGPKPGGTTVLNLSDSNSRRVMLQQRLNDSRDALKFVDANQVLQDFQMNEKPRGMRLSVMGAIGGAAGFFIGFLVALFYDFKTSIAAMRKNRQATVLQNDTR